MTKPNYDRPWQAKNLIIVNAQGTQILYLGGSLDGNGKRIEPTLLCKIVKIIVAGVNNLPLDFEIE